MHFLRYVPLLSGILLTGCCCVPPPTPELIEEIPVQERPYVAIDQSLLESRNKTEEKSRFTKENVLEQKENERYKQFLEKARVLSNNNGD